MEEFTFEARTYSLCSSKQIVNVRGPWGRSGRKAFTRRRSRVAGKFIDESAAEMLKRIEYEAMKHEVR